MVNYKIYFTAAVITIILLIFGFTFNWYFTIQREEELKQTFLDLQTSMTESQLELTYLTEYGGDCSSLEEAVKSTRQTLYIVNKKLETYENYLISDLEFRRNKAEQTILYVKLWLTTLKIKEICETDITTILYFFDVESLESKEQGYVLDAITEQEGDKVIVIPLDFNFDLGIIRILSKEFDVITTPTIIVNEQTKLEGLQSRDQILA